ncbi:Hypothetical predicted protein [Podarcis lilfordi]|uniref:Uncharacterized protein n=1 Tax=Podarcis lilfordi TaxID=74358 RepID=A0AA35KUB7_9SAUR|nr:Hypothetical predicted protein [Podarcis lilfordi]
MASVMLLPGRKQRQPFRRVTFSVVSQPQDPHQGSLQSCYDSGLEESETPSSKSSSGPRLGALPLPEDNYERTTPDGSVEVERLAPVPSAVSQSNPACAPVFGCLHDTALLCMYCVQCESTG